MNTAAASTDTVADPTADSTQAQVPTTQVQQLRSELRSLVRRVRAVLRGSEPAVDLGLGQSTLDVLGSVVARPRTSPAGIADHLGIDPASAARHVSELAQLGLIVAVTDLRHPAYKVLMPTSMGRRIHGDGLDAADDALQATLVGWSADEVETLTRLLAKLNQSAHA